MFADIPPDMAGGVLTIDLAALATNYLSLASLLEAHAVAAAVVKADAYGLGARRIAPLLETLGCSHFFVAHLHEAIELKPYLSSTSRLYVLNGLQPGAEVACEAAGVVPVLNGLEQAWRWRNLAFSLDRPLPAVIQIDTGMARLGMAPSEIEALLEDPAFFFHVPLKLVMSHLACSNQRDHPCNATQLARFQALADQLPPAPRSLANSGGALFGTPFQADLVRLGVSLYGAAANDGALPMKPVVRLGARVIQVRDVMAGEGVGYDLTYARQNPGQIATIAVGYADGLSRRLSSRGAGFYEGVRLPFAGRVSMDSITLDISVLADHGLTLSLGDEVELLGPHQTLDDLAAATDTIPYELLTGLGHRYHRNYVEDRIVRARSISAQLAGVHP